MSLQKKSIFVLPLFEQYILHAPLHGITALVNEAFLVRLQENWLPKETDEIASMVARLSKEPFVTPGVRQGPIDPVFLGIIPTRACNLACRYCAFGASDAKPVVMEARLAEKAVDWMAAHIKERGLKNLDIHFFGGEPFFALDLIETVVARARAVAAKEGLVPGFEVSTNGFFSPECCQFVADHIDVVVLSFDGPENLQNLHRPSKGGDGSFRIVSRNAAMLAQSAAELNIRACVTQNSVASLDRMAEWFCQTFAPHSLCFEPLQPTPLSDRAGLHSPDPWKFAQMVQKASRISSSRGIPTIYNSAAIGRLRSTFCPVGKDALIISPDGSVDACYLQAEDWETSGLDLHLGTFSPDGRLNLDPGAIERARKSSADTAQCNTCFCRWYCAGGCHVKKHAPSENEKTNRENFCIQTRILTACNLLDHLGCREEADSFIQSKRAMQKLALQSGDTLQDWNAML
jgi:uncharacterized protein